MFVMGFYASRFFYVHSLLFNITTTTTNQQHQQCLHTTYTFHTHAHGSCKSWDKIEFKVDLKYKYNVCIVEYSRHERPLNIRCVCLSVFLELEAYKFYVISMLSKKIFAIILCLSISLFLPPHASKLVWLTSETKHWTKFWINKILIKSHFHVVTVVFQ